MRICLVHQAFCFCVIVHDMKTENLYTFFFLRASSSILQSIIFNISGSIADINSTHCVFICFSHCLDNDQWQTVRRLSNRVPSPPLGTEPYIDFYFWLGLGLCLQRCRPVYFWAVIVADRHLLLSMHAKTVWTNYSRESCEPCQTCRM